jgi:hypothetical protein
MKIRNFNLIGVDYRYYCPCYFTVQNTYPITNVSDMYKNKCVCIAYVLVSIRV